ncbi:MAG: hypothetical protein MUF43_04875 [Flavobacterium sp.]|jgi:hypothetical protein|nr:hypothetical protein [Flavobacterium sp.]
MKKILLLALLTFYACDTSENTKTVSKKEYSLELPGFLSEGNDLNEEASLQYRNYFKEFYVIVIDESKSEFNNMVTENEFLEEYSPDIEGYSQLIIDNLETTVTFENQTLEDSKINGLPTKILKFEGKYEDIDVYYQIAFIQSKKNYYQIMSWTLAEKRQDYEPLMDKMMASFKTNYQNKVAKKNS